MFSISTNRLENQVKPLCLCFDLRLQSRTFSFRDEAETVEKQTVEKQTVEKQTVEKQTGRTIKPSREVLMNTHRYIVKSAIKTILKDMKNQKLLEVVNNDKRFRIINFFEKYIEDICKGSIQPDYRENDSFFGFPTFQGHFFDPDTHMNYRGYKTPTAFTRFVEHASMAKKMFETGNPKFAFKVGQALHYLCDAGEPHHSSNQLAYLSNHLEFEKYARGIKGSVKLDSGDFYYSFNPNNLRNDEDFKLYCQRILLYTARFSKKDCSEIDRINFSCKHTRHWRNDFMEITLKNVTKLEEEVLKNMVNKHLKNSQNVTTAFLYNFMKAVGIV
jgi:hypothetical protein